MDPLLTSIFNLLITTYHVGSLLKVTITFEWSCGVSLC